MPTNMVQASYTSTAWKKLVQPPENRMEALKPVLEKLGGGRSPWPSPGRGRQGIQDHPPHVAR